MDIYLDRMVPLGQLLPFGQPDVRIALGEHVFHVADAGAQGGVLPVRLSAAVYCGATDVLNFIAEPIDAPDAAASQPNTARQAPLPAPRPVQLADLLPSPPAELPRLTFDAERITQIAQANEAASIGLAYARLRGLLLSSDTDGRPQVTCNPNAQPSLLTGVRSQDQRLHLTASNAQGQPRPDLEVSVDELTQDARQAALAWMSARHAALADVDALQALQPALRAISKARNPRQERGNPDAVTSTIQQHRARANLELAQLLDSLRGPRQG